MEYYKELFFTKKKHSYDLYEINFHSEDDDVIKYENKPTIGLKLIGTNFLDPITGYIFHPKNAYTFKEYLIEHNILINGVCMQPIIFEYIKDGTFNIHLYNDIKPDLIDVSVNNQIALCESKPGMILRNINDESYYIYLGMVGQYYVSSNGTGMVRKKHLTLKTDYIPDKVEFTSFTVSHTTYVDYTKDTDKDYFLVKEVEPSQLEVKYYSYSAYSIPIGRYILKNRFDVSSFIKDYPDLMLSGTVRAVFDKDDISMTRNKVELVYQYVGKTGLDLSMKFEFEGYDSKKKTLYNASIKHKFVETKSGLYLDFDNKNYTVKINDEMYFISMRRLDEICCYTPDFSSQLLLFKGFWQNNIDICFFKMGKSSILHSKDILLYPKNKLKISDLDFSQEFEIYEVYYRLNEKHDYNLINNLYKRNNYNDLTLEFTSNEIYKYVLKNKQLGLNIFGEKDHI